jgi:hypothetical protein
MQFLYLTFGVWYLIVQFEFITFSYVLRYFFLRRMIAFISEVMRALNYIVKCVFYIYTSDLTSTSALYIL